MNSKRDYNSEEYKQAVLLARAMSGEEKIREGGRLFQMECEQMEAAIRKEMPELCEEMVRWELRSRFDHRREEEDQGFYITLPPGWKPNA